MLPWRSGLSKLVLVPPTEMLSGWPPPSPLSSVSSLNEVISCNHTSQETLVLRMYQYFTQPKHIFTLVIEAALSLQQLSGAE